MQNCWPRSRQVSWHGRGKRFVNFDRSWTTLQLTLTSSSSATHFCNVSPLVLSCQLMFILLYTMAFVKLAYFYIVDTDLARSEGVVVDCSILLILSWKCQNIVSNSTHLAQPCACVEWNFSRAWEHFWLDAILLWLTPPPCGPVYIEPMFTGCWSSVTTIVPWLCG